MLQMGLVWVLLGAAYGAHLGGSTRRPQGTESSLDIPKTVE